MTTPGAAVTAGFRNYARFDGRATRPEFWWWKLFITLASIVILSCIVLGIIAGIAEVIALLGAIFGLATLLPTLAVTCRRLHDIGESGWLQLLWHAALFLAGAISYIFTREDLTALLFAVLPALLAVIVAIAVSLAVLIWAIIWLARQGQPRPNRYGPDPRAPDDNPPAYPGQTDWYTDDQR